LHSKQELIKAVVQAFDTVNGALFRIYFSIAQDGSIAWRTQRFIVLRFINDSHSGLYLSSEELVEVSKLFQIWLEHFIKIDAVQLAKSHVNVGSDEGWQSHVAQKTCKSA
jgi:hypothetical protein